MASRAGREEIPAGFEAWFEIENFKLHLIAIFLLSKPENLVLIKPHLELKNLDQFIQSKVDS